MKNKYCLFMFLDGIGLGPDDPNINPFSKVEMPNLQLLFEGRRFVQNTIKNGPIHMQRASLLALDACLDTVGLPQSATGQSVLLTGKNIPKEIGYHYGPKPNPEVAAFLDQDNIFCSIKENRKQAALLNAYPPAYFTAIQSGRRIYSAIPHAVHRAGLNLKTDVDLANGQAIAADFTADGWHSHLNFKNIPRLSLWQSGAQLAKLAKETNFSLFEYWLSDYAGHKQDMAQACKLMQDFDQVLGGLLDNWGHSDGIILITSDHGNMEDLSTRRHTMNFVPAIIIGSMEARKNFSENLVDLTGIASKIKDYLFD